MSAATYSRYRRVVVRVRESAAPARAFRLAAELAHLLELDLQGVFIEDEALLALAGLPFARELSLPAHTWQALDPARILEDFHEGAERTRRLLADAAARLGMASGFSVLRGDPAAIAAQSLATDILVIAGTPADETAWHSGAAILLVPLRPRTAAGAIAVAPGRASLATAAFLARRANEDLLLILSPEQSAESLLADTAFPPEHIRRRRVRSFEAEEIAAAVRASNARLLVLDRATLPADATGFLARLAALAATPVLAVGDGPETAG